MLDFLLQHRAFACVRDAVAAALLVVAAAHASAASTEPVAPVPPAIEAVRVASDGAAPPHASRPSVNTEQTTKTFVGEFQGTGRACSGELKISAQQFRWKSAFSRCSSRAFKVSTLAPVQGRARVLYELGRTEKSCRYRVVVLSEPDPSVAPASAAWDATGYRSASDYAAERVEHSISCAMVKTQ